MKLIEQQIVNRILENQQEIMRALIGADHLYRAQLREAFERTTEITMKVRRIILT